MELSILIVNFNGGTLVDTCLETIFDNPPKDDFEVILVDNASTDGSLERVQARFPQVIVQANDENVGLADAFNDALRLARGNFLLSLDNDTRILPGALQALIDALRADNSLGVAGSFLYNPDMTMQRTFRRTPSALNAIFGRRSLITKWWPGNPLSRRYLMEEQVDATQPFAVDWVSTAALMVTREVYEQVGGLDEDFFVYWVDADWCSRIKAAGFGVVAVPASQVIHDENLKAKRRTPRNVRMVIDFHRGAYLYYRKNRAPGLNPMAAVALVGLSLRAALLIAGDYLRYWALSLTAPSESKTGTERTVGGQSQ